MIAVRHHLSSNEQRLLPNSLPVFFVQFISCACTACEENLHQTTNLTTASHLAHAKSHALV
jgi:hypothetical protein